MAENAYVVMLTTFTLLHYVTFSYQFVVPRTYELFLLVNVCTSTGSEFICTKCLHCSLVIIMPTFMR
jgi:hypothetical protein